MPEYRALFSAGIPAVPDSLLRKPATSFVAAAERNGSEVPDLISKSISRAMSPPAIVLVEVRLLTKRMVWG
jgi:hypothetical protein